MLLYLFPFFFSCGSAVEKQGKVVETKEEISVQVPKENFETGKIIPAVKCKSDSANSYALYLPKNFSAEKKLPIIFLFDPHAKGSFPLEKYKLLAEKYHYILIGSNNSKNGNTNEESADIVNKLLNDVSQRISFDNQRMYIGGFSGGARVAGMIAMENSLFKSLICCGAGFSWNGQPLKFDYIGFAGKGDFNMTELEQLDAALDNSSSHHFLDEFDGKHEWPDSLTMEDGFLFLEFSAMKNGSTTKNDSLIKNFSERTEKKISKTKNPLDEFSLNKKLSVFLEGLTDISVYKKKMELLTGSAEFKSAMKRKQEMQTKEMQLMQDYGQAIQTNDEKWWASEVQKLNSLTKKSDDESQMHKRILAYISIACYSISNSALKQNALPEAEKFLRIYKLVDPPNSEHAYLLAVVKMKQGDKNSALAFLKEAVKLGFDDWKRMEKEAPDLPRP